MKWYYRILIALLILVCVGFVLFWIWYNAPLAEHMDLDFSARSIALNPEYTRYWGWIGAGFALMGFTVVAELAAIIYHLRKK